ncbi:MAG: BirA family biotin operon repressor/biotin-[acetyl-CoA-carboxylase] ligase [Myxococcota bacterium]|jgi:BirA family biotin operon repressor/biotin-[acetyl-CoA-carboxylase] ligase
MAIGHVDQTQSTNDDLAAAASAGAPHGTALVADRQLRGRGRLGRSWDTAEDGLALSVLLRPTMPLARVPLLCLAAATVVARVAGDAYRIKWPNDVLAPDGRKVSGILAELEAPGGQVASVVVGIGLNLAGSPALSTATSLLAADGRRRDRWEVAARVVHGLLAACRQIEIDPAPVLDEWRAKAHTLGRAVQVGQVRGIAVDIDPDGALRVDTGNGHTRVLAGDVRMIERL